MNCYKIIFVKNEIISCVKTREQLADNKHPHFEHHKGQVIHAIIKAASEENAKTIAQSIIKEVKKNK